MPNTDIHKNTELYDRYNACFQVSKKKGCPPSVYDGLELYGLIKQSSKGDINKSKPSAFHVVERAKWEAWHKKKGLTKEQAMEEFIRTVKKAYSCSC
ncbi:putative acyl-CoA-binding protein [Sitophilus oryzae]|uniref:Acyl-CoA-binding protein n=1 Tax=Sitophilus oryzae TaxID=7048 RepID=A0A6J2YF15_SITOR|nr:putative acyl-CoA-binding protein [Sitophilus oryzae]